MEINQSDRDALRLAQQKVNPQFVIGNIVEHKAQNPKGYKQSSRIRQSSNSKSNSSEPEMPKIEYKSEYLNFGVGDSTLTSISEDQEPNLPPDFKDIQSNMWINMDQVEFDKLEWMSSKAERKYQEKTKKSTRFDKEGRSISETTTDNETETIEGHDIDDLIKLLDSHYQPQVAYALSVISKIAALATMGFYDGAFSENIHSILIRNCLLRVRHHIDSKNETICQSALKCMRSLLCNTRVDEIMLDRIHPIISDSINPNLWLRTDEEAARDFDIELKDVECVEIDAVLALIHRTDIIKRFFYLLETKYGAVGGIYNECILDILIRIARHSPGVCQLIDKRCHITCLINLFLPPAITSQNSRIRPLSVKALKFIRLIAHTQSGLEQPDSQNYNIPEEIIPVIESYYFIDCYSYHPNEAEQLFKLYIETLRMMKVLCKLKKFRGSIISIMAMGRDRLLSNFRVIASLQATKHLDSKISIDWQYAAHLIDLVGMFVRLERYHSAKRDREPFWHSQVGPIFMKWLADVIRERYIPHIDVSIALATAAQHYIHHVDDANIEKLLDIMVNSETTRRVDGTNSSRDFFRLLVKESCEKSQFKDFLRNNGKQRDPKELPSFGCLRFNSTMEHKLNPLFDTNNPHILLSMFIHHLQDSKSRTVKMLRIYIDNIELIRYIKAATCYFDLPLSYECMIRQSLFAQYEVEIISRCLLLLGRYYIGEISEFDNMESRTSDTIKYTSSSEFKLKKKECYSNLCYYTISIVGLLSSESDISMDLKDQLFEQILFNPKFQIFVSEEHFLAALRNPSLHDTTHQWYHHLGSRKEHSPEFWLLKPIYMNQRNCDRFWILRPLIDYYKAQTVDPNWLERQKMGDWFEKNLCNGVLIGKDIEVIMAILELNYLMMIYSPAYTHFIVKQNIEDQLVTIGTLFLSDDIFLDETVSQLLTENLSLILYKCTIESNLEKPEVPFTDANKILRSLDIPLADFFNKLVEQFESVSYGNHAFSNFLLLFISPQSDKIFRKKLFQEKLETCLGQLRTTRDNVWVSTVRFNLQTDKEKDPEIKALLRRSESSLPKNSFIRLYCRFHGN